MAVEYMELTVDINPDHASTYLALGRAYFCECLYCGCTDDNKLNQDRSLLFVQYVRFACPVHVRYIDNFLHINIYLYYFHMQHWRDMQKLLMS